MIHKTTPSQFVDKIFKLEKGERDFVIEMIEKTVQNMERLKEDNNKEQYATDFDKEFRRNKEILKIYKERYGV